MVIKTRAQLRDLFRENAVPTSEDFKHLINSALVRRDDQFFGLWSPGVGYKKNDVVLYKNGLYSFLPAGKQAGVGEEPGGNTPPDLGDGWQPLQLEVKNQDWKPIFEEGSSKKMIGLYAKMTGQADEDFSLQHVSVGTDQPGAFLHLNDVSRKSQLMFNPKASGDDPALRMVKAAATPKTTPDKHFENGAPYVEQRLAGEQRPGSERVLNQTNTQGYVFKLFGHAKDAAAKDASEPAAPIAEEETFLMFITSDKKHPRVGIGASEPAATLDLLIDGRGQILADAGEQSAPEILIVSLEDPAAKNYLSQKIDGQAAQFVTNAEQGFVFKKGGDWSALEKKAGQDRADFGKPLLVVRPDGRAGLGTETPAAQLEIVGESGKVQVSLHRANPSVNVIDPRGGGGDNDADGAAHYAALGTSDEAATLTTNGARGFVFKRGADLKNAKDEIDVKGAQGFLSLKPEGANKDLFNMQMNGPIAAQGLYVEAAPKKSEKAPKVTDAVELLKKLTPVKFRYENRDEQQYGFRGSDMQQHFRDAVKSFDGLDAKTQSIAYQNLVAVLVRAVQELDERLAEMEKRHRRE